MPQFNLLTSLVAWATSFFKVEIAQDATEAEAFAATKEAAEAMFGGLNAQITELRGQVGTVASNNDTALNEMRDSLKTMASQLTNLQEANAAAVAANATMKTEHEKEIKDLKESFASQLAGTKDTDGTTDHATSIEGKGGAKKITVAGWQTQNGITKTTIN
jgi:hypothetical protein